MSLQTLELVHLDVIFWNASTVQDSSLLLKVPGPQLHCWSGHYQNIFQPGWLLFPLYPRLQILQLLPHLSIPHQIEHELQVQA